MDRPGTGMFRLDGVAAVVTGGGRGIGLAIAAALAGQGARLTVLDRDGDLVAAAGAALGAPHRAVEVNVTDHQAVRDAIGDALGSGDGPGVLVNNAAVLDTTVLTELTPQRWDQVHAVNLTAALVTTQAAAAALTGRGGRIINVSSIAGRQGGGLLGTSAYATSKGALLAFTRSAARELAPAGITVNAVAPGPIATALLAEAGAEHREQLRAAVPLGRLGAPADIAATVCFLASAEAGWITGAVLDVNGGSLIS